MPVSGDDESMNTSIEAERRFELLCYGETDSYYILDGGHFALDTKADEMASLVNEFMKR
jgi:hypothetical protein